MLDVRGTRIFVGLSGGVDSGVTVALLQRAGAQVTGVFIKGWYPPGMPCTWAEDRRDAMRVAAHLGLPFQTLDASLEYKRAVIDYLLAEYRAGRTPNPDIMCNREVKFGVFHRFAKAQGADCIATGHYARAERAAGITKLMRGVDESKDQSYFLWAVPKEALDDTLLPLGGMHKEEVRKTAARLNLPNARKKDSQGICFLGNISVEDFLREEFHPEAGRALSVNGAEVGAHGGAVLYTLGERVALSNAVPGPWYVVAKDLVANDITVSKERASGGSGAALHLTSTNWFNDTPDGEVEAQYRYHGPRVTGAFADHTFTPHSGLPEPIACGQSLVVYRGDECLGGGIIE
jgi:tRNA-specific 2-thiouridylase